MSTRLLTLCERVSQVLLAQEAAVLDFAHDVNAIPARSLCRFRILVGRHWRGAAIRGRKDRVGAFRFFVV